MTPLYLRVGGETVAAIYQAASNGPTGTAVLLVPPFGWDDQTSYRARRDWSVALSQSGFSNLRIDLPGTGDSSGSACDAGLLDSWTAAVASGVDWLRSAGAVRVAVISLGLGGLVTLNALAGRTIIDDLVLWGVPTTGKAWLREFKAFGRLEQSQTGESPEDTSEGELCAGGHVLTPATIDDISTLDAAELLRDAGPKRALVLGRDGSGPDKRLVEALASAGAEVRTDPGRGWGDALARPQCTAPTLVFETVNAWLSEQAKPGRALDIGAIATSAELGSKGVRVRETPIVFEGAGQQLYAILTEPVDAPPAGGTAILFNAGAIRRIGPNRMWTEAARRWAAAGVPVLRVDVQGIGDAGGDGSAYSESDESFYTNDLTEQCRAAMDLAVARGLPQSFLLGGLCSGAFWAFQLALSEERVKAIAALNPRMLLFDARTEGGRELRKLTRLLTASGLRNLMREKRKLRRAWRLVRHLLWRTEHDQLTHAATDLSLLDLLSRINERGLSLHIGFSGDEPLLDELRKDPGLAALEARGAQLHELPSRSHTLKPLRAQIAAHAMLDEILEQAFDVRAKAQGMAPALRTLSTEVDIPLQQVAVNRS